MFTQVLKCTNFVRQKCTLVADFLGFGYVEFLKFIGEIYFLLLIYYQYNGLSAHASALNTACSSIEGGTFSDSVVSRGALPG